MRLQDLSEAFRLLKIIYVAKKSNSKNDDAIEQLDANLLALCDSNDDYETKKLLRFLIN